MPGCFPRARPPTSASGSTDPPACASSRCLSPCTAGWPPRGVSARRKSALTGGAIPVGGRLPAVGALGAVPVLLAGDAAGLAHPISGAGIAAAVQSGGRAGWAAAAWAGGQAGALADYDEELAEFFDVSLGRARQRRAALHAAHAAGRADPAALRRGWIAYDEYWAEGQQ